MKHVKVKILGKSYALSCPDEQENLLHACVERVDADMTRIREAGKVRPRENIAVLVALNLALELTQLQRARLLEPTGAEGERLRHLLLRLDAALGDSDAATVSQAQEPQPTEQATPAKLP